MMHANFWLSFAAHEHCEDGIYPKFSFSCNNRGQDTTYCTYLTNFLFSKTVSGCVYNIFEGVRSKMAFFCLVLKVCKKALSYSKKNTHYSGL